MVAESPLLIHDLEDLGTYCPSQWRGLTPDGSSTLIHYRHGWLSVYVNDSVVFGMPYGDEYGGVMGREELNRLLPPWIVILPEETA